MSNGKDISPQNAPKQMIYRSTYELLFMLNTQVNSEVDLKSQILNLK